MPALVGPGDRIVLPSGRTSSLARPSVPWANYGQAATNLLDGRAVSYRELATTQPWVAIAVNGIARQISRLPLKVYRREGDDSRVRDRESRFAQALARPGRRRSAANFKHSVAVGLLVDGNHCEELVFKEGQWTLRKLDWRWLIPYTLAGEVVSWDYCPPDDDKRPLDINDVIHYRWETEGGLGVSPLKSLGITLRSEDASQRWSESNFMNGTRMGVAVIMDKDVKSDQKGREALREEIEGRYSGPENAGRPMILGGGVSDVKDIGAQTPVEASLIEQRKLNREEVLGVYNWPPPIAGDLEHGTFSNVAELAKIVFRIVLPPWTGLIQEETTLQMINPASVNDHYAEFDYGDILRGDPKERMAAYNLGLNQGVLTLNDTRRMENLPAYDSPGADEPLINANNRKPLSQVVAEAAAAATGDPADTDPPEPEEK